MSLTRELETLFLIILASAIGLFAVFSLKQNHSKQLHVSSPLPQFVIEATPTPTSIPSAPQTTITSWNSSDGVKKLTMKKTVTPELSTTYVFSVTDTKTQHETQIFTWTLSGVSSMSIPFNTFSPDDAYVFIKETIPNGTHYFVLKASGEVFADGKVYEDVTALFTAYTTKFTLQDVTGWAAPELLVVNTENADKSLASYWLDVTSNGFIPLATQFQ